MATEWEVMIFAFARIAAFLFTLPFLSGNSIPSMAKVVIALGLSAAVADNVQVEMMETEFEFIGYIVMQVVIGITLAKLVEFMLTIPSMAGGMMDFDMGFSQSQMMDPSSNQQGTILSGMLNMFFLLIFILLDGIQQLIMTLIRSFELTETLRYFGEEAFLNYVVGLFMYMFTSGIQIALPVMGAMFVINFVLIIMGRTAPQMQIFVNMFAVKITAGILFLVLIIPLLGDMFTQLTDDLLDEYINMFNYLFKK